MGVLTGLLPGLFVEIKALQNGSPKIRKWIICFSQFDELGKRLQNTQRKI